MTAPPFPRLVPDEPPQVPLRPATLPSTYGPRAPDDQASRRPAELEVRGVPVQDAVAEHATYIAYADAHADAHDGEQRVRDILESITDGFYSLDDEGRFTYVNAALERIAGRTRAQMLGRVAWELFDLSPDSVPYRKYQEARRTGQGQTYQAYVERIDRWLEFRSFPAAGHYSVFIRDVTEQRRQDEALRKSEERWRLAGQATADLMYDWDITTGTIYFSDALRSVYGHVEPEPRIGWWEALVHPDDLPAAAEALHRAVEGNGATWKCEYRFRRADGSWVTVLDRGCFVRDADGRAVRMIGAMQDVTEQRRVEEQLLQSQKMEVMGQLAAGVAHDFNNVLTAMFGYLEIAEEGAREGVTTPGELAELRRVADQAAALTRQLLLFSRRQLEHPRPVDLTVLVDETRGLLQRLLGRAHRFELRVTRGLWPVRVDPTHAEQVLMNLVLNARDAMPEGGTVTVELENTTLEQPLEGAVPATLPAGAYVRLVVSDSGVGMDAATLARIWEPFFTTKGVLRGTGLGLSTVRGLVARAGGGVVVYTTPGKGSAFAVYLPREMVPAEPRRVVRRAPDGTERVLLVEDDATVRDAVRRALERHGYTVEAPEDVREAMRRIAEPRPMDVVVLDAELDAHRTVDVPTVLEALSHRSAETSLIVLAGVSDAAGLEVDGRRCVVLDKPFTTDALLRALRSAIEGEALV